MSRGQVRTARPDGTQPRYLGALGTVGGLVTSWTVPGGCEQLTCAIAGDPRQRTDALDPGRDVQVIRGGDVAWEGTLDEPQQGPSGWAVTAHGSGTWGSDYGAIYTGAWATAAPDQVIADAIARGLGWQPGAIGHPTGMWLKQPPDSASIQVDAMLDLLCSPGGLTWHVKRTPAGNTPQVFALPTWPYTPNYLLVCADPAPRTLAGDVNAVNIRYMSAPDLGGGFHAVFSIATATDAASIARHGRKETFVDLSSAGAMLASDALAVGNYVLQRYQRASFSGPFVARPGQLLTIGGQPISDLGFFYERGPMVVKLLLLDQGWGGEVNPGPVNFLVGRYEHDEDADTATITPFQQTRQDFATMLSARASLAKGREFTITRHGRARTKHHRAVRPRWHWGD